MYGITYHGKLGGFPYEAGRTLREAKRHLKNELEEIGTVHLYKKAGKVWNHLGTFHTAEEVDAYR